MDLLLHVVVVLSPLMLLVAGVPRLARLLQLLLPRAIFIHGQFHVQGVVIEAIVEFVQCSPAVEHVVVTVGGDYKLLPIDVHSLLLEEFEEHRTHEPLLEGLGLRFHFEDGH